MRQTVIAGIRKKGGQVALDPPQPVVRRPNDEHLRQVGQALDGRTHLQQMPCLRDQNAGAAVR